MCCGYGTDGKQSKVGYDCVVIPGASKATLPVNTPAPNVYCGRSAGLVSKKSGDATANKTICSEFLSKILISLIIAVLKFC